MVDVLILIFALLSLIALMGAVDTLTTLAVSRTAGQNGPLPGGLRPARGGGHRAGLGVATRAAPAAVMTTANRQNARNRDIDSPLPSQLP